MPLRQPYDFGTIYSKNPAGGLGTTPSFTTVLVADRAGKVTIEVVAALIGGSTAGNLTLTAQGSRDGTNFSPIAMTTDATAVAAATGSVTTSAGAAVRALYSFNPANYKGGVRVSVVTAGAPNAGDLVSITAEAQ